MRDISGTLRAVETGAFGKAFSKLYAGRESLQTQRYAEALKQFDGLFGGGPGKEIGLFSSPGRAEIGGNHTDHQRGCVMAAAIDLDIICVASKNADGVIRVYSQGHKEINVDLCDLSQREDETGSSVSIVRGIAARCRALGYKVGGFDAYTTSEVPRGSGLSSSAAFETAVGTIISRLFNGGGISAVDIAKIGRFAENVYYGKPCGLMDQMASSVGGLITVDFKNADNPEVMPVESNFAAFGHSLCIVDTKGEHADLTAEYAAITAEMRAVASFFGKDVLADVDESAFYKEIPALREIYGDRAVLRAMHFFGETKRPELLAEALRSGDFERFKHVIIESGESSFSCLQNAYSGAAPENQGITLALELSKAILNGHGAWRVHGGGFAGTIQAFVPDDLLSTYSRRMESVFGEGACHILQVRNFGGVQLEEN